MTQDMPKARVQVAHPYLALMGLYMGGFTGMYSETALNIALPQLSLAFGVDISLTQWLVVGYMLAIGIVLPFASLLMKWFSARSLTVFALGAFLVGSLISGFASGFEIALTGRVIQGIGTGLVLPMMFAMVMEVIPPHKLGSAMGITALVIMFAPAIGPTLAGIIVGALSWRFIFFSFALVLVVGIIFALKFEVNPYELTKPHLDVISVLLSCLGFGGIVFGVGVASLFGWLSAPVLVSLIVGIIALALYAKRQFAMQIPVLDLRAFSYQGFRVGAVCMMLNFGITLSAMYVLPQYYQNGMLIAVALTGIVMLPGGVVNALVSMFAGKIFDRIGARIPALCGFALSIVGAGLLMFATPESSLAYVICCHIIMMVGVPLAMSPCQTHALSSLPHKLSTDGSTILNTMQQVLGAVCTAIATNLLASGQAAYYAAGGSEASLAFTQGSHWGFLFALALAVVGFLFALRIKKRPAGTQQEAGQINGASREAERVGQDATSETEQSQANLNSVVPLETEKDIANTAENASGKNSEVSQANTNLASLMKTEVYALRDSQMVLEALQLFAQYEISGAPVLNDEGELVGFVSDGDIIATLSRQVPSFTSFYAVTISENEDDFAQKVAALTTIQVKDVMTKNVIAVQIDDDLLDVCKLLTDKHLKKAPVLQNGKMVGVINRSNITAYAVEWFKRNALEA